MNPSHDHRPRFHITPPSGWLNDPNGLTFHEGRYHVFYQANPRDVTFGNMEWAHISSEDLLTWQPHPPALQPSQDSDRDGCWTGCVVLDAGVPTAVYTGVQALGNDNWTQQLCLARSDDDLIAWNKADENPAHVEVPADLELIGFRDPYVWAADDGWLMVIGTGLAGHGGAILLYESADLTKWTFRSVLYSRAADDLDPLWTGSIWECPSLADLGDGRHMLLFSVWDDSTAFKLHYAVMAVGRFDGQQLNVDHIQRFDYGHDCYAPALLRHPDGRLLSWAWSWEGLTDRGRKANGWAGCLTLPREVAWKDGAPCVSPARKLQDLCHETRTLERTVIAAASSRTPLPIDGATFDLSLSIDPGSADEICLLVRASSAEETVIRYRPLPGRIEICRDRSSTWSEAKPGTSIAPLALTPTEKLRLRVIADHSIIEVFGNERVCLTERIYPIEPGSTDCFLYVTGGTAILEQLSVSRLSHDTRSVE